MSWSILPDPASQVADYRVVADGLVAICPDTGRFRVVVVEHNDEQHTCDAALYAIQPMMAFDNPIPAHFEVVEG